MAGRAASRSRTLPAARLSPAPSPAEWPVAIQDFNLLHAVQTAGKARFVAQHQAVELLIKLGEGDFLLFCHSVIGQSSAGKISFEVLP